MKQPKLHENGSPAEEDSVAELLSMVNPRPVLSSEQTARLKAAVRPHWQRQVEAGRFRRRMFQGGAFLAAAATLLLALGLLRRVDQPPTPPALVVASLEMATGPVGLRVDGTGESVLDLGGAVPAGGEVESTEGRAALRLASGLSLRLDRASRVRFLSGSVVELDHGRIYVDSDLPQAEEPAIEVRTRLGVVQDIGTQFEVRLGESSLRLRVREGRVWLAYGGETQEAEAGAELRVAAGGVSRGSAAVYGPLWDWVQEVAPAPELEGQTLTSFLAWVTRETGWRLRFAEESLATSAPTTILHGSIDGLPPERALDVALQATDLSYRLESGTLVIESAKPGSI